MTTVRKLSRENSSSKILLSMGKSDPNLFKSIQPISFSFVSISAALIMGFIFGFVIEKGRVFEPSVIIDQMLLNRFIMIKMFLSAAITSLLVNTIFSLFDNSSKYIQIARNTSFISQIGSIAVICGSFILGVGMTICGACPGTVAIQLGAGTPYSELILFGSLIGAIAFAFLTPFTLFQKLISAKPFPEDRTIDTFFQVPFWIVSVSLFIPLIIFVLILEYYFPWRSEINHFDNSDNIFIMYAWAPEISGIFVGLNQIPGMFTQQSYIGSSGCYSTLAGNVINIFGDELTPTIISKNNALKRFGYKNWWQVYYIGAAVFGGFLASYLANEPKLVTNYKHSGEILGSIIGGFLIMFGARMAGGCTTGNGISGFSSLSFSGAISVPFMFIGGIVTAFTLKFFSF